MEISISLTSGASWGNIKNTETLIEGARVLVDKGCDVVAVVVRFPEDEYDAQTTSAEGVSSIDNSTENSNGIQDGDASNRPKSLNTSSYFDAYRQGKGVDAIAGAEAIISRVISKALGS